MYEDAPEYNMTMDVVQHNSSNEYHQLWESSPEAYIVPALFTLIFIVGVVGNGTLIYIVLRNRNMRNVSNILLVSLAIGDMLLVVSVPFTATMYSFTKWPYGEVICRVNAFLQTLSLGVSVFTLVALSVDRYFAIKRPMPTLHSSAVSRSVLVASYIWLLSVILAAYSLYYAHVHDEYVYCEHYPKEVAPFFVTFNFFVYFAAPMVAITALYIRIAPVLIAHEMPTDTRGCEQRRRKLNARKKVAKLVLCFVLVFIACWLPRHTYLFWYYYGGGQYNIFWHVFKIIAFCLSFINSCINPLALYLLSRQFRRYYDRYLFCCYKSETTFHATNPLNTSGNLEEDDEEEAVEEGDELFLLRPISEHQIQMMNMQTAIV